MGLPKKAVHLAAALDRFNRVFALMSIIPLLVCVYVMTSQLRSVEFLLGINGITVLLVVVLACLGYVIGRSIIRDLYRVLVATRLDMDDLVTERDKTRQELTHTHAKLIQSIKMETVGQLAAGAAHEVKNPLAMMLMGMDYLSKRMTEKDERTQFMLDNMRKAIHRVDHVVRGLLDYASIKHLDVSVQSPNLILDKVLDSLQDEMRKRQVNLTKNLKSDLPFSLIDTQRFKDTLSNVVLNALNAMPSGGTLTVTTSMVTMKDLGGRVGRRVDDFFKPGDTAIQLEIKDTGEGIPPDILDRVFDPFFTTRREEGATGLGLAVVRNIVEMHQGMIQIGNRKSKGVRVQIYLKPHKGQP